MKEDRANGGAGQVSVPFTSIPFVPGGDSSVEANKVNVPKTVSASIVHQDAGTDCPAVESRGSTRDTTLPQNAGAQGKP